MIKLVSQISGEKMDLLMTGVRTTGSHLGGKKKDKIKYILHQKKTPKIPENVNETIPVLEKRVGELLCNLGMGKDFLTLTQNQT